MDSSSARGSGHSTVKPLDERKPSLRDQVAARLRHALVAGDFEPGEVLTAPVLAAQFGVSATPVREAMLDLTKEGHVAPIRYKGYRVVEISAETRRQILELRRLIEIPLMVEVTRRGAPDRTLADLEVVADASVEAAARGDLVEFIRLDMELHLGMLALSGNDVAVRHVKSLRSMARLVGLKDLAAEGSLVETAEEHRDLVRAAHDRDAELMKQVMDRHLGHVSGVWAGTDEESSI